MGKKCSPNKVFVFKSLNRDSERVGEMERNVFVPLKQKYEYPNEKSVVVGA